MTTKKLTNYMKSLGETLTSDNNLKAELRDEIIKRLEELEEMKKGIHKINQIVKILKKN